VVVGNRPTGSPSLADDAGEFTAIANALWGQSIGKGRVITGNDVTRALVSLGLEHDFYYENAGRERDVMFLHRRLPDGDVYFLSNRTERQQKINATFRVSGKRPELWHADTGQIEPVSYRTENGRTTLPLHLESNESLFVVFRQPSTSEAATIPAELETKLATVDGTWDVQFAPNLGAPEKITLGRLSSWTENMDPGVKYYSGTASYHKTIDVPAGWMKSAQRLMLDLGDVRELAEVSVNGRSLGIVWHPPYRIDVTSALKPGANALEVKVTNLWVNRLIGDQQPDATKYTFTVAPAYKADAPLRPSGLLGPVTIAQVNVAQR
jgi:hypothetical protein